MCHELGGLNFGFAYDPDDSDGGVFIGNSNYDRFKAIVEHITNCNQCLSEGWRGYARPVDHQTRDGKLWYGNVFRDERTADQYFWLMGIDLEKGTRPPRAKEAASIEVEMSFKTSRFAQSARDSVPGVFSHSRAKSQNF
jgi:hypothetical protein